jgi:negative regulator of flagellin synthesis FlgM
MSINFNGINPNTLGSLRSKSEESSQSGKAAQPAKPATSDAIPVTPKPDNVSLSSQVRDLKQLEGQVRQLPEVNQDRVARIKAALADGSYTIDNEKLAGKLLNFEGEIS